jgi:hypothetical protein
MLAVLCARLFIQDVSEMLEQTSRVSLHIQTKNCETPAMENFIISSNFMDIFNHNFLYIITHCMLEQMLCNISIFICYTCNGTMY